ncbi:MAG: hypothetical protein KatS3mg089_0633 [Patescibacteria group bacterium]|nr:MAG: hypothetical protein KatS3mg089_0633 [Patescibacteria group bacterium]
MELLRNHQKAFKIIMIVGLIALILSSFLPFIALLF